MTFTLSSASVEAFRTLGFLVLRNFFEPSPLAAEVDRVLAHGVRGTSRWGDMRFQYVPMMTTQTPVSLALLDRAEAAAASLLGGPVLPTRAKCVRYVGDTPWHVDSEIPVPSVGVLAYLEPQRPGNGLLRVIPRSHQPEFAETAETSRALGLAGVGRLDGQVDVTTEPGDVIVMDEHLLHGSVEGTVRRQWRTDFLRDPHDTETEVRTKAYFARLYAPDWRADYDVVRYPTYGPDWRSSGRPSVARLETLGVYELAARQEARWFQPDVRPHAGAPMFPSRGRR